MTQSFLNKSRVPSILLILFVAAATAFSQTSNPGSKNNPYSPSPGHKAKQDEPVVSSTPVTSAPGEVAFIMQNQNKPDAGDHPTVAQRTYKIAKNATAKSMPPTETYKVGVGDVLFVNLKNSAQGSRYCTVREDGTIDFPLAGENLIAADQTVDDIEQMLASGITLFTDPRVEVKVREYGSHRITVSGMVDRPGEKNLQREAMPLFTIRAESVVDPKATKAVITRAPLLKPETYALGDANTDNVLIYPGNSVDFTADSINSRSSSTGFYFISGEITTPGQKELTSGLTLYQAVAASGGTKGDPKKAFIRRKDEKGVFSAVEHDLRAIKNGKTADIVLSPGDVIEIRN